MNFAIDVRKLGSGHLAITELAGIPLRGKLSDTPVQAVQNLLYTIGHSDDGEIALELALDGQTLTMLESGD